MRRLVNPDPELDLWYKSDTTTVYLLHFATPIHGAQHYIGSTTDLDRRMHEHRRTWPLYRIDETALNTLAHTVPDTLLDALAPLYEQNFRRKHTFLKALHKHLADETHDLLCLKAAKRHKSNGLVMRANQLDISWCVARTWKANRDFEMYLKRQKNARRYCPVCHDEVPPEESAPF
jgi:hypothetical protein